MSGLLKARVVCSVGLLLELVACSGGSSAKWEPLDIAPSTGFLSSVWGSSADDVFVVGGAAEGEIHHYDGSSWKSMEVPQDTGLLVWVFGFGPSQVYAVGVDGAFIEYDGSTWAAKDPGTTEDLWGIWGRSPSDLWIVGGSIGAGEPVLIHYDGDTFSDVGVDPEENPAGARALFKVWGIGSKTFAVGQNGLILELSGEAWVSVPAGVEADEDFVSLWGTSESNIVVVGGRSNSQIARYDGSEFETVSQADLGGTSAVFMADESFAYVGGSPGYVGQFSRRDAIVTVDVETDWDIHGLWGDENGTVYAVGGIGAAPFPGTAYILRN